MSSSANKVSQMCGLSGLRDLGIRVRAKRAVGKGEVDSQHETGLEGSLHPCTKGYCS
jgi:hypothetical protein